ncbi:MAG: ATP-binding protein [Spirochaetes bacterium]|nr:ATP-binding protein [Spirochaetota bacterium]
MKAKKSKVFATALIFLSFFTAGCEMGTGASLYSGAAVSYYRDLPGVTAEEIAAIAALRESRGAFSYAILPSSEAFVQGCGTIVGFAPLLARFLSDFFDIPFNLHIDSWENIIYGLNAGLIDFNSDLTPTPQRRQDYFMSHPVAQRHLVVFSYINLPEFYSRHSLNGLRVGFLYGTVTYEAIINGHPYLYFEAVNMLRMEDVPQALAAGYIDAFIFIVEGAHDIDGNLHGQMRTQNLFPTAFIPVSLTTADPELQPIITVFNRYIETGGIHNLYALFKQGFLSYARYMVTNSITASQRLFISSVVASGSPIPVGLEPDNYPISFFNSREGEFQGIVPDILAMVTDLTGLPFQALSDMNSSREDIIRMLKNGDVLLISELNMHEGEEFQDYFLWGTGGETPFFTDSFIFMSRVDFPGLQLYQVMHVNVGVVAGTIYETLFDTWFPDALHVRRFDDGEQALAALGAGAIDLFMTRANTLLAQTNFHERAGYRANIVFSDPQIESFIGFGANAYFLQRIFESAMLFVDVENISRDWVNRFFDHARAAAQRAFRAAMVFAGVFAAMLVGLIFLLRRNRTTMALYKEKAAVLNAIYKTLPDVVHCKDAEGRYTSCNPSFEKFAHCTEAELVGKTPFELYGGNPVAEAYAATDKKVLSENIMVREETWRTLNDGSLRFYETYKAPLLVEDKVIGLLSIGRDMTAHKRAMEAANDANKKKGEFLAHMSHEIRTPMNAISGMAELSLNSDRPDLIREYVGTIKHASASLLAIVNDILDFSKIEAGKIEIVSKEYSLASLVNDVINITKVKAADSRLRFMVNIDSRLPDALIGDDIRVRQVLLNLLSNAFKYTERGFVTFFVSGEADVGADGGADGENEIVLTFQIADTGLGIREEDMEKLFSEYAQFDLEKNRGVEGTGLGLPIVKRLLDKMGGEINVFSEYGKGSRFTVTLPQKFGSDKPLVTVKNPHEKRALAYEPREIYRNFMSSAFNSLGVPADFAASGEDLREKALAGGYPFVFMAMKKYKKHAELLEDVKKKCKVVVLSEFGHAVSDPDISVLGMPFHSIILASILNSSNQSAAVTYNQNDKFVSRFTAPDANILVVDDIVTNLKVAKGLLLPYKANVDICKNGATAVEAVKANSYDLIFMDHKMPGIDGIEATHRIRELADASDSYFKTVPIIALTANVISGSKEMFLDNGLNDFLSKPIDTVKLEQILELWLPKEKRIKN